MQACLHLVVEEGGAGEGGRRIRADDDGARIGLETARHRVFKTTQTTGPQLQDAGMHVLGSTRQKENRTCKVTSFSAHLVAQVAVEDAFSELSIAILDGHDARLPPMVPSEIAAREVKEAAKAVKDALGGACGRRKHRQGVSPFV